MFEAAQLPLDEQSFEGVSGQAFELRPWGCREKMGKHAIANLRGKVG